MSDERDVINEIKRLLAEEGEWFIETDLSFILPLGAQGYALDSSGKISGIKIGFGNYDPSKIISLICECTSLVRLVFAPSPVKCELPPEIKNLKHLQYCWLAGSITKLPPELLSLQLPIYFSEELHHGMLNKNDVGGETLSLLDILSDVEVAQENHRSNRRQRRVATDDVRTDAFQDRDVIERLKIVAEKELSLIASITDSFRRAVFQGTGIFLQTSDLEDPPLEIISKGREAISTYFSERSSGSLPLNELKVLLVGNGSAGKTSLVKRMLKEDFDPEESQTHGINIRTWYTNTDTGKEAKLNFWDFGGQEIMHATHQFFLSKRSVYILVLDGRKEEDPEYWLQHIESFGGDSPIMIVLNKIDEHPSFDVNRRFLMGKYAGIIDFFKVSCATGAGISEFTRRLSAELDYVPMLQTLWPRDWFKVKQRLEKLGTSYISLNEYQALCGEENVDEVKNQDLLVDFLNDLGVVLHFKDMELLDTHVLDPRWVTEAVYRIINSELLAKQKGILRLNQLGDALKPRTSESCVYLPDKYRYIVDLMLKFELCYRLDKHSILVPDLLDIQEPAIVFEHQDELRFVFEYTYLPKSIMPRFIVRMHKDIKGGVRWRTGVLLEEQSLKTTALVVADEKAKRINVYVAGKQKRDYFATIRKVISDLNSSFEKLGVTEKVPLPDTPDVMLDYIDIVGHEQAGIDRIFVGRLGRHYEVQRLLNGIEKRPAGQNAQPIKVLNVGGNYFDNSSVGATTHSAQLTQTTNIGGSMSHQPRNWEKIVVYTIGVLFIGVVSFLIIRNQPIADPNLVVFVRIILSVMIAVFGATIPGMLKVDFSAKGLTIRAMGALALFVITYILTPKVL